PILIESLRGQNEGQRIRGVEALSKIGLPATRSLISLTGDNSPLARAAAVETLGQIGGQIGPEARECVPSLIERLKDRDQLVRRRAARALGYFWEDAKLIIPALTDSLGDNETGVVANAAFSLGQMGAVARTVIPRLTLLSTSSSTSIRRNAAR